MLNGNRIIFNVLDISDKDGKRERKSESENKCYTVSKITQVTFVLNNFWEFNKHEQFKLVLIFWHCLFFPSSFQYCSCCLCLYRYTAPASIIRFVVTQAKMCCASSKNVFGLRTACNPFIKHVISSTYAVNCLFMSEWSMEVFSPELFLSFTSQMSFKLTLSHEIRCSINLPSVKRNDVFT